MKNGSQLRRFPQVEGFVVCLYMFVDLSWTCFDLSNAVWKAARWSGSQYKDKHVTKVQASKFADLLAELQEEREKLREQQDLEGDPILLVTMLSSCSGDCRLLLLVEDHMPSFLGHRSRWGSLPTTSGEGCLDLQHFIFHC